MRIWSLHPRYLDTKGLVALWRETLLAKHVLAGKTRGYKNHPQLIRFMQAENPVELVDQYLSVIHNEALERGYKFDATKFGPAGSAYTIPVTKGQLKYEWKHLLRKLKIRDPAKHKTLMKLKSPEVHPVFQVVDGGVENWEKVL